jgi:hypothetical protein
MAESKSRKTGEHNLLIVKLTTEAAAMREQIDALEARMLRLEAEVAGLRKGAATTKKASIAPPPTGTGKRPGGMGPPPLPRLTGSMAAVQPGRKMSMSIDVSEIAELVESMPPPGPRSKR